MEVTFFIVPPPLPTAFHISTHGESALASTTKYARSREHAVLLVIHIVVYPVGAL
jgi:hypothetical protein